MASGTLPARGRRVADSTRERTVILNQLVIGALILLAAGLLLAFGQYRDLNLLVGAMTLAFVGCGASVVTPWNRLPHVASAVIPLIDTVAIAFLREASPNSGLGLLWVFPAMWAGWAFGVAGVVAAILAVCLLFWLSGALNPQTSFSPAAVVLLPVTVAAISVIAYFTSNRATARRELLERQSRALQHAVERARQQEDLVTEVLDAVDFGVVRISANGTHALANGAHAALEEARRAAGTAVYGPDGTSPAESERLPLARAARGETFEEELVWYGAPGSDRRALRSTVRRLRTGPGEPAGSIAITRDVTAEELALRAREDLVASVSHELRTPLTSVVGYLDLALEDGGIAAPTRRSLEIAQRNGERLLELVSDILAASRGAPPLELEPAPVDLAEIVRAAAEAEAPRAAARGIELSLDGVEPAVVRADARRIRQVVDNLLSNSVKYNRDDGQVEIGCAVDGEQAWIVVRDRGPGIAAAEQARVFDRFFRSETVRGGAVHGSGLGLAISRELARAHGGDITLQSVAGEGAAFVVRLPVDGPRRADGA